MLSKRMSKYVPASCEVEVGVGVARTQSEDVVINSKAQQRTSSVVTWLEE
jgi:hypothetical protein